MQNSFSIYVFFIISLIVEIINSFYFKGIKNCKWKVYNENSYDKNRSALIKTYINVLYKLKLIYFLGFGSELGALRNGGVVHRDHDVDVIIPVWLNYKIFHCNEYLDYYPHKCYIYSNINTKVCNKTKFEYMMILKNNLERVLKLKIDYKCRFWTKYGYSSCWTLIQNNFFLDLWILIGFEYYYQNFRICKCSFSNSLSYCTDNPIKFVAKMYGKNWTQPITYGSGAVACKVILSPNNKNSKLKKYFVKEIYN